MYVGKLDKKAAEKVADSKLGWSYHEGGNAATAKTSSGKAGGGAGFACYGKDGESAAHRTPIYTPLFGNFPVHLRAFKFVSEGAAVKGNTSDGAAFFLNL